MSVEQLNERERFVLNHLQGNFPVKEAPFEELEARWDIPAGDIINTVKQLERNNFLSRFGAVINTRALGGDSRLAALRAEPDELEDVARHLNEYRTVTHNYARDHELNLWFVLSADDEAKIDRTLEQLENELDRSVYNLPKITEYYVGLRFQFHEDGDVTTRNIPDQLIDDSRKEPSPSAEKQRLIRVIQDGIPIESHPFRTIARRAERTEPRVLELCREMLSEGIIKRLGCVPNHYKLGVKGNAMTVFDVPDNVIDEVGQRLGRRDEVTHCYERPRHEPVWPYNLFAMVHAPTREKARRRVKEVLNEESLTSLPHEILFSSRLLKKTGLRL
jgi:DNA-binding Lrp family transcriptional regulator